MALRQPDSTTIYDDEEAQKPKKTEDGKKTEKDSSAETTSGVDSAADIGAMEAKAEDANDESPEAEGKVSGFWKGKKQTSSVASGALKKKVAMIVLPVIIALLMMIIFIFSLVGNLKAVHFATVLRSTGFASTQLVMRRAFADTAYSAAVLSEDSVGVLDRPGRTMLDRLRGINVEKTMKSLNREGAFNVVTDAKGNPAGFDINGKRFMRDDIAGDLFKNSDGVPKTYKELSYREKLTLKNETLKITTNEMADVLEVNSRSFNNAFFKGFRAHFDIRTSKWAVKARDFFGKSPDDALRLEREQSVVEVKSGDKAAIPTDDATAEKLIKDADASAPESTLDQVNEASGGTGDAVAEDLKKGLNQRTKDWVEAGFKKAGVENISEFSDAAGKVSLAVFATTIYCTIRDLSKSLDTINATKEAEAQRYAHDIQTTSDQIKAGDTAAEAVSATNKTWDGHNGSPGAEQSPLYYQATGQDPANAPAAALDGIPSARMADNPIHDIYTTIDGALGGYAASLIPGGTTVRDASLNAVCGVALNPIAQATVAGADVIIQIATAVMSGGSGNAIYKGVQAGLKSAVVLGLGIYGGNAIGEWLDKLVRTWSGTDFSGAASGTDKFSAGAVATDSMNSHIGRGGAYGRILNNEESNSTKKIALADIKSSSSKLPLTERYFAIDNPYSLIGRMSAVIPTTSTSLISQITSLPKFASTHLLSLFSGKNFTEGALSFAGMNDSAMAAPNTDFSSNNNFFGVQQWGWSPSELDKMDNDESYQIINNASWVSANISADEQAKLEDCYKGYSDLKLPEYCTQEYLSTDAALHWRVGKLYNSTIDQLAGTETESSESTTNTPVPELPAIVAGDTSNLPCNAGTDAGAADGYRGGKLFRIKLCKVQGISVNAQVATNVDLMLKAAKQAGVTLSGGAFRTMESQKALRIQHGCPSLIASSDSCSPPTARPGYSNHQMGLAIDFNNCSSHSTACWKWLNANAATYGFKNFAKEPWHWSPDGK